MLLGSPGRKRRDDRGHGGRRGFDPVGAAALREVRPVLGALVWKAPGCPRGPSRRGAVQRGGEDAPPVPIAPGWATRPPCPSPSKIHESDSQDPDRDGPDVFALLFRVLLDVDPDQGPGSTRRITEPSPGIFKNIRLHAHAVLSPSRLFGVAVGFVRERVAWESWVALLGGWQTSTAPPPRDEPTALERSIRARGTEKGSRLPT